MSGAAEMRAAAAKVARDFGGSVHCDTSPRAIAGANAIARMIEALPLPPDDARELLSSWMLSHGYATGHGDSVEGLLGELEGQIAERDLRALTIQVESGRMSIRDSAELTRLRENSAGVWKIAQAEIARLRDHLARKDEALREIAREQSAENAIAAADKFQSIARAALHPLAPGSKPLSEGCAK